MTFWEGEKFKKPDQWAFDRSLVDEKWGWFHDNLVGAWLVFPQNNLARVQDLNTRVLNHGTPDNSSGDLTLVTTAAGPTINFSGDATNDRIDLGSITSANPLSFFGKTSLTLFSRLTVGLTPNSGFPRVFDKSNAGNATNGWGFWIGSAGGWDGKAVVIIDGTPASITATAMMTTGETATIDLVIDGLSIQHFYKNGVLFETNTAALSSFPADTTNAAIGNWNHSTDRMWRGSIDYVYVLNGAATPSQVAQVYSDPFGPFRMVEDTPWLSVAAAGGLTPAEIITMLNRDKISPLRQM